MTGSEHDRRLTAGNPPSSTATPSAAPNTEDGDQLPASLPAITAMGACMPLRFPDQHRDMRDGRYEHHRRDRQPARPGCE
jgi:hypothetical protein